MPSSRHARITRTAISPRLAMRILRTMTYRRTILSEHGRSTVVRGLLVRVRELEEARLAPGAAEELEAGGQRAIVRVAHRYGDRRKAGARRKELVVVAAGRVEVPDEARRVAPRRIDER